MKSLIVPAVLILASTVGCSGTSDDDAASGGTAGTGASGGTAGTGASGGTGGAGATGGAAGTGAGTGGSGAGSGGATCGGSIVASPENDYAFTSTLSFPPIAVKPDSNLTFEWGGTTKDFLKHSLDPMNNVDSVNLMLWKLTQSELETKLNDDALAQRDLAIIATVYTQKMLTSSELFDFTSVGTPLTPCQILPFVQALNPDPNGHPECADWAMNVGDGYDPAAHIYTVMLATGEELGQGTRMIQSFKLDPASTNTTVTIDSTSTVLDYSVDLHSLTPTMVPAGTPALSIDWTGLTTNGLGKPFNKPITRARIGRYTQTPAEMEAQFLDLDMIADKMWSADVPGGMTMDLSQLTDDMGQPFPGIDASYTWIVALDCGSCANPAPWYLSLLEPCTP